MTSFLHFNALPLTPLMPSPHQMLRAADNLTSTECFHGCSSEVRESADLWIHAHFSFLFARASEVSIIILIVAILSMKVKIPRCKHAPERTIKLVHEVNLDQGKAHGENSRKAHEVVKEFSSSAPHPPASVPDTPASVPLSPRPAVISPQVNELRRGIQRLLNKVCPESIDTLVPEFAYMMVNNSSGLGSVVNLILQRAQLDPHYIETYADLIYRLDGIWRKLSDDEASTNFQQLILKSCNEMYEALPRSFEPTAEERASNDLEELEFHTRHKKDTAIALMRLMGNLFLWDILSARMIASIMEDLVDCRSKQHVPCDHHVECACVLVASVGASLSGNPHGQVVLTQIFARLQELRNAKTENGSDLYSKRLQFTMQNTLDLRDAAWVKKSFSPRAVKKDELRDTAEEASLLIVAGERPQSCRNAAPSGVVHEKEILDTLPPCESQKLCEGRIARLKPNSSDEEGTTSQVFASQSPPQRHGEWCQRPLEVQASSDDASSCCDDVASKPDEASSASSKKVVVRLPDGFLHTLIGLNGETVRMMQEKTGARIFVHKDANTARLTGSAEAVDAAKKLIDDLLKSDDALSPAGTYASRPCKWFMAGRCGKGDTCTYLHPGSVDVPRSRGRRGVRAKMSP
jgi:hypothetical protein